MVSSGSKEVIPSDRHASVGGGSASSTKDAGQRPRRKVAEQISLLDESYTAAPEADKTVSTKLAGLAARARKMACEETPSAQRKLSCAKQELEEVPNGNSRRF